MIFTNCDALAPWSSVLSASLGLTDVRGLADVLDNLDILCDLCVMLRKLSSLRYKQSFARTLETIFHKQCPAGYCTAETEVS